MTTMNKTPTASSHHTTNGVAADDVYLTGRIDNALSVKPMVISLTLRFNDVLDADKLHTALCTLLDTGDWRRLGGRLRAPSKLDNPQVIQVHVPRPFTAARPPLAYSHADHSSVAIAKHALGSQLPVLNATNAALCRSGVDFREFAAAKELPDTIDGFLKPGEEDRPVLSLHITSFADATLVAVAVPHLLMDAMALGELIHAWTLVLAGKSDEVPPVIGIHDDILYDVADPTRKKDSEAPWSLQPVHLVGFSFFLFVVRFLWGVVMERTIESRAVYIPRHILDKMRARAIQDIADAAAQKSQAEGITDADTAGSSSIPWVSEGDVLFAWTCRVVSLGQGSSPRPLNAHNAINMRNRLPETTPPKGTCGVYARNFVNLSYLPVSPDEARGPLGLVAAKYRAALTTQGSPQQAVCALRAARASVDAGKDGNVICGAPATGELLSMTNWLKADIAGVVDFSPAIVAPTAKKSEEQEEGGSQRWHAPGRLVYLHSQIHASSPLIRNTLGAVGKDSAGNLWMQGFFPSRTWDALEKELVELNKL